MKLEFIFTFKKVIISLKMLEALPINVPNQVNVKLLYLLIFIYSIQYYHNLYKNLFKSY